MVLGWASEGKWGENLRRYNVLGIVEVHDGKKGPKHGWQVLAEQGTVGMARDGHGVSQQY